jgi:ubiquinone/menaquinone biosynthesis C-methylase UbiE
MSTDTDIDTSSSFEGTAGRVAAAVMARLNRDMERAAIDELDPAPDHSVLAVGFGPGVGLAALGPRLPHGRLAGIDPSATMLELARRRNRVAVESGRLVLTGAGAEAIPWPDASFDGVLAVNSIQLWRPLDVSVSEVARVLRPGATLVTVTHTWAIEKSMPVERWIGIASDLLTASGLHDVTHRTQAFRSGGGLVLRAHVPHRRNQIAP